MTKPKPAPVGVALIVKDGEKTLPVCLKSLRPFVSQIVVAVDERTTDKTRSTARKHGADVIVPVKVSDWHECPDHGRVLAQHFGNARNASFTHLDPALPFWMWIDADDILVGGEHLADVCASIPEGAVGAWLEYHYSTINGGAETTTLFDRERILRSSVGWRWDYRVHEVVVPLAEHPRWVTDRRVKVYHQEGVHKTEASTTRNQLLLEIDWEEEPDNQRTAFYLANGYFAAGDMERAVEWYETTTRIGTNPWEIWQSFCYESIALRRLGDLDGATQAAFCAIDAIPDYKEPYFRLAEVYLEAGEFKKAIEWGLHGLERDDPPRFVFKNPLDTRVNIRTVLADAYAQLGHVAEARRQLEAAQQAAPSENGAAAIERYKGMERDARTATAFLEVGDALLRDMLAATKDVESSQEALDATQEAVQRVLRLYTELPDSVKAFGRTRDFAMPFLLKRRPTDRPRIVFWCGRGAEPWAPPSLNGTGIGGSETAVVKIAERFAADGWRVDVYNGPGKYEGEHGDVGYWEPGRWGADERADVLVSWRQPALRLPVEARAKILWLHDHNGGPPWAEQLPVWDRVLGVSAYHRDVLADAYALPPDKAGYVPNGIDLDRFDPSIRKKPFTAVYASSPDRGLLTLLDLWPKIAGAEKAAKLTVAYGFETMDKWINAGRHDLGAFKDRVLAKLKNTPRVEYVGRLPQDELARLYAETVVWLYPSDFLETSCITAMETMAAGCVPVTSSVGALKETVGEGGVVVWGPNRTRSNPYSPAWRDYFVKCAQGVLFERNNRLILEARARERAKALTWDRSYREHWKPLVEGLLSGQSAEPAKELVAA